MFGQKKQFKVILGITITMLMATSALAEQNLTLEKAIQIALENNKSIQSSKVNLESAKSRIIQARSGFLPRLGFNGTYTWLEKSQAMKIPAGVFGPEPVSMTLDFTSDYVGAFSLTQPLFTGGRIQQGYKITELGLKSAQEDYKNQEQKVIFSVKKSFYNLLFAQNIVEVTREALSLAQEHARIIKVRYDAGEVSQFDLLRAEVEVANLNPQLIKAKNGVNLVSLVFKNILGINMEEEVRIDGKFQAEKFEQSVGQCLKTALENRPEIALLNYQKDIANRSVKLARANNLPSLSAVVNYQLLSQELFDRKKWQDTYSGMLVLSIPLFDGFYTRGKVKEARAALQSVEIGEKQLKDGIELEVRQAYLELMEANEIIISSQENVKQAQKSVDIAEDQFAQGYVTSLDVMSSQLALTTAKTNYIQALHDQVVAMAKIDQAMGTIK